MSNPIVRRELVGVLRSGKAVAAQLGVAGLLVILVLLRWPAEAQVGLSGAQSQQALRAFAYGLLTLIVLLAPAFPAAAVVKERLQGTLPLLLVSPLGPLRITAGKLAGVIGLAALLLSLSLPAAAACYAMGGVTFWGDIWPAYVVLFVVAVHYASLALWVSSLAGTIDSALRLAYGAVLLLAVGSVGPHLLLQGAGGRLAQLAEQLRCASPLPALMEVLGQGDVGGHGLTSPAGCPGRFLAFALAASALCAAGVAIRLQRAMLDRPRPQGRITQERGRAVRLLRRMLFLVDPQRRKRPISRWANPVMVKEFRSRRFGRFHWVLRLTALCAVLSLGLTYAATMGTIDWGVETIAGLMVLLQTALVLLLGPAVAAGLIAAERESGGWDLLRLTPLSGAAIVAGKLLSAAAMLVLVLGATLPGYLVMLAIRPELWPQVWRVLVSLGWTAVLTLMFSAAVSSLCRRAAAATTIAYAGLAAVLLGTLLFWLGRDAPFGRGVVQAALSLNPLAAALSDAGASGFASYRLTPAAWRWAAGASAASLLVLAAQTTRLTRPQ